MDYSTASMKIIMLVRACMNFHDSYTVKFFNQSSYIVNFIVIPIFITCLIVYNSVKKRSHLRSASLQSSAARRQQDVCQYGRRAQPTVLQWRLLSAALISQSGPAQYSICAQTPHINQRILYQQFLTMLLKYYTQNTVYTYVKVSKNVYSHYDMQLGNTDK